MAELIEGGGFLVQRMSPQMPRFCPFQPGFTADKFIIF
jgi:hypothetical protein